MSANPDTYWNHRGKFQAQYEELWGQVPSIGRCERVRLEAVRCMSALYYDLYNNGGGNWYPCYDEEWDYLWSLRWQATRNSDEMSEVDMHRLDHLIRETMRIIRNEDWCAVFPPDDQELFELFEKLANAVITWAVKTPIGC